MIDRRVVLSGLGGGLLSALAPSVAKPPQQTADQINRIDGSFLQGCVFARSPSSVDGCRHVADYWTARVSDLGSVNVPESMGCCVVWDDIFSARSICQPVERILAAIQKYYLDPFRALGAYRFQLDGFNSLEEALTGLFDGQDTEARASRTAVVDLQSVGLTDLEWADLIGVLKQQYNSVIGLLHVCDAPASSEDHEDDTTFDHATYSAPIPPWVRAAATHCDTLIVTSDTLFGISAAPFCPAREVNVTRVLTALSVSLSEGDFFDVAPQQKHRVTWAVSALDSSIGLSEVTKSILGLEMSLKSDGSRDPEARYGLTFLPLISEATGFT